MKIKLLIILLVITMCGCQKNAQIKAVMEDFRSSPKCDTKPVYAHEQDTKDSLKAKVLILNYKVACMYDWYYYFMQKLKSYEDI